MNTIAQCQKPALSPAAQYTAKGVLWLARGVDVLAHIADFLERAAAGRRALRQLANADDRMLKDIGLDRSDLRNAAAQPLYRDPTALLAGRVDEGRTHEPHRIADRRGTPSRYY
jgi:uncharacterized protein YjiS (DUF1127 family)